MASKWKSIKSAPKDGTEVLIYSKELGIVHAQWKEIHSFDNGNPNGLRLCYKQWVDAWNSEQIEGKPTHWTPLPAPPIEKE